MTSSRRKIVILDDSEVVRELMREALEERWEVITVETPIGFSNLLRREQPSLALVDVNMPLLRGDKLVELATRKGTQECPIILFSDLPEAQLRALAQSSGAQGYIRKSGDMPAILRGIDLVASRPLLRR